MRSILSVLIISLFWNTLPCSAQTKTHREQTGLLGCVTTVTKEMAEFTSKSGRSVEGRRRVLQTVTYDAKGNKVEQVDFNPDGSVAQKFVYTYDAGGRATGYEDYTGDLSTPRRHVYVLDLNGNRAEYMIIQPDGSPAEKYLYKYNANGNKVAEALYHKGTLISRNENAYDENGGLISQVIYNPDGTVSSRSRNSNDRESKLVERIRHDDDVLTYRVRYTYDGKGRLVGLETVGSFVQTDAADSESYVTGKVVYVYKGKDQPKERVTYNPDGSLRERVIFAYDSRGNWIKKTHLGQAAINGKPATNGKEVPRHIEYRTITYY